MKEAWARRKGRLRRTAPPFSAKTVDAAGDAGSRTGEGATTGTDEVTGANGAAFTCFVKHFSTNSTSNVMMLSTRSAKCSATEVTPRR